ncbi:MAG: hypothetical protein JJU26_13305 [Oceanicaulis sp.]|uniref:hypothetical protein n=1 Tax=Glycocaulis sp. TaxID=1969725 RepID=UPI0025BDB8A4|nr:hypothetical protein [Glycocaulis sp.]MCC5982684.1 hypothetical protein [Oceanicaulis sp.]MCH8522835.1 hypothetical protein [Glycocaulis sp.]
MQSTEILLWLIEPTISFGVGQCLGEANASLPPEASPSVPTSPSSLPAVPAHTPTEATHATKSVTWAEFLSPLSFSVALNMAYFTVSSFVNPIAANQRKLLAQASAGIDNLEEPTSSEQAKEKSRSIGDEIAKIEYNESNITKIFRSVSLVFFFLGVSLVAFGSFYLNYEAPSWLPWVTFVFLLPFVIMSLYVAVIVSLRYQSVDKKRRTLSEEIQSQLAAQVAAKGGS